MSQANGGVGRLSTGRNMPLMGPDGGDGGDGGHVYLQPLRPIQTCLRQHCFETSSIWKNLNTDRLILDLLKSLV